MSSLRRHEGYLFIDHTQCEGVTESLVMASGKQAQVVGAGQLYESATVTCSHCNRVVILNPERTRPRGYCRKCDHYVCDNPACNSKCTPFEEIIEQLQEQAVSLTTRGI